MTTISGTLTRSTPFITATVSIIFILNTIFGLYKYYTLAQNQTLAVSEGLPDGLLYDRSNVALALVGFLIDILATLNPFGLLKVFLVFIMQPTPILYDVINTFVLNPIGLVITLYEINYVVSKIPTVSPEV